MKRYEQTSQAGAALITVLMIVAAMSAVALSVTQLVLQSTERARIMDAQAQMRYFAVAAEEIARARLFGTFGPLEGRLSLDYPGYGQAQIIPVQGGLIKVTVRDATNCFDLNGLTSGGGDEEENRSSVPQQFDRLVALLGLSDLTSDEPTALVAALLDWMDADSIASLGGAEDAFYVGQSPAYRTPGQPLSSLRELRAVRGFDSQNIAELSALLCVRPPWSESPVHRLNLNTLEAHHAPLLKMALPETLTLEDARSLIADRPVGGWQDLDMFQQMPVLAQIDPALINTDEISLQTSLIEVLADVVYRDQVMQLRFLFEVLPERPVTTLQRQRIG